MTKYWDVATVGEIYIDHVFSGLQNWCQPGEEVYTRNYVHELGGGAAITACSLGRLGRRTAVFGVVGEVENAWIRQRLNHFHVDTRGLQQVAGSTGVTVSVSVHSERSFYSYLGSNEFLGNYLATESLIEQLQRATHVHFAAPLERRFAEVILPALKNAGCTISLDVGWQPEWYQKPENLRTCLDIDYFLPNRKEAECLTSKERSEEVLLGLEQLGFSHAVVKLGAKGAAIRTGGKMLRVPSPQITVVDTTGAGDAFNAGLIDAVLSGADAEEMLRRAAACGALSTRTAGALNGLPTRQEIEEIYVES
jgi:sugar/nucleoside kinase (ribokinase family)